MCVCVCVCGGGGGVGGGVRETEFSGAWGKRGEGRGGKVGREFSFSLDYESEATED